MNEIYTIIMTIIETPGMASRIGLMIAAAMILGFVLLDNYHIVLKVMLVAGVLIIFEEWMQITLIQNMARAGHPTTVAGYATVLSIILFTTGLVVGAAIGIKQRQRTRKTENAAKSVLYEVENGGIQKT